MELHITPKRPSFAASMRELFAYRDLLWILAYREVSVRYKQTAIGILWVVIQPVLTTVLFTFIGRAVGIPSEGIPYSLYVFCGMTLMGLFVNSVGRAGLSVIADERLITKVYFPRATIPLASIVSSGFDYLIALALLFIVALCYGYYPGLSTLAVIPATLIVIFAASGLGAAFAGWTVRYRDFRYVVPFFLQLIPYASPTFFPLTKFPDSYRTWLYINPMCGAIELFRHAITGVTAINPAGIAISSGVAVALFFFGGAVFQKVEQSFADHI
jgi:lipopolysaccharide transport system permease protein